MAAATLTRAELAKLTQPRCAPCSATSACATGGKCLRTRKPLALAPAKRAASEAPPVPTEHEEQVKLFAWAAENKGHLPELGELFAVPNGARTAMSVAKRLKAEGLKKGVEDMLLLVARGGFHGLCLEMKRVNGVPSDVDPAQRKWHEIHRGRGYRVVVCNGWEEGRAALLEYLSLPPTKVIAA